jgi:hypothetical protein
VYASAWSPRLRQGDIFGKIHYPLSKAGFQLVSEETSPAVDAPQGGVQLMMVRGNPRYAMVLSHDCEFNEGKRPHFLIGRIEGIPKTLSDEQVAEMVAGNNYEARAREGKPAAIDTFVVDPLEGAFDEYQRVSFSSIVPLPMSMKEDMLKLKCAELDHEQRVLLRSKLAAFFGRSAQDVPEDYKEPRPADSTDLKWKEVDVPEGVVGPEIGGPGEAGS